LDFIFMSSENEIVDQPDNTQPDPTAEIEASETAVTPSLFPENQIPQPELEDEDFEEEEMDWDSWLLTSPEAEEVVPEVEPDEELDGFLLGEEMAVEAVAAADDDDDVQVDLAEAIMAQFEEAELVEIVEAEEELVELLAEVEKLDAIAEAAAEADALETVAEAIAEAEVVVEHLPGDEVEADLSQSEEPVVKAPPPANPKKQNRRHPQGLSAKDVVRYFAPCGRCGYFLTGYRASFGEANFETAVYEETGGWLTLTWSNDIPELFVKSYGRVVEANDVFFSSACPECYRALTYAAPSGEDQLSTFRIEVKPQSGNE
jgi:hypothetical protein